MNECDFCQSESEHLYPINDDLWAICRTCMVIEYDLIPKALRLRESKVLDDPETPRLSLAQSYEKWLDSMLPQPCRGLSPLCTPEDCKCGEEE